MKYTQLVKAIDSASQQLLGRAAAAVNQSLVLRNWLIGAYIVQFEQNGKDRAKYGMRLIESLAHDLKTRGLRGLGISILERSRRFYLLYPEFHTAIPQPLIAELGGRARNSLLRTPDTAPTELGQASDDKAKIPYTVSTEFSPPLPQKGQEPLGPSGEDHRRVLSAQALLRFSWSHWMELIRVDDPLKRAFYENESLKGNWSVRQLQRQIGSLLYERTGLSTNKKAVVARAHRQEPHQTIQEIIRDPYVLEFTGLAERPHYHESDLEKALLDDLQAFLLELGTGFCFEARQFRVTVGTDHDYLDLVFYHRTLRCHVLLDLKVRPFRHADAGQMNYYVNYFKNRIMASGDGPPVGIILCSDRDQTKVEFATAGMDNKLFVSRYLVNLPTPEQLSRFVEQDRARFEALVDRQKALKSPPLRPRTKKGRPGIYSRSRKGPAYSGHHE